MRQDLRPVIFGISGYQLSDAEKKFLADARPLGVILFKRNVESLDQLRALTTALRDVCQNPDLMIAIDQEGGRVARIQPPLWPAYPPMRPYGDQYNTDPDAALDAVYDHYFKIGTGLLDLGITMNCAPVLDVPISGSHDVIGDRAFSQNANVVAQLGMRACCGLIDAGVYPVIKHIPGHGRAMVDSHLDLPRVDTPLADMEKTDFPPFAFMPDMPFAMTAHVVYTAIDAQKPATLSPSVIEKIIRKKLGFMGLLMTDDLGMKALQGTFAELTRESLRAGCEIVLHCSGKLDEMQQIVPELPTQLSDGFMAKMAEAMALTQHAITDLARRREALKLAESQTPIARQQA